MPLYSGAGASRFPSSWGTMAQSPRAMRIWRVRRVHRQIQGSTSPNKHSKPVGKAGPL